MDPLVTTAGSRSVDELLDAVERGRRVIVRSEWPRDTRAVTIRWDGRVFYCETPRRRHRHETRAEIRECLASQWYASS